MSGELENVKKFGPWFSHEGSPRAQIFKRDHNKVVDMGTMMKLMRYARVFLLLLLFFSLYLEVALSKTQTLCTCKQLRMPP